jgi:hypothetical protein
VREVGFNLELVELFVSSGQEWQEGRCIGWRSVLGCGLVGGLLGVKSALALYMNILNSF